MAQSRHETNLGQRKAELAAERGAREAKRATQHGAKEVKRTTRREVEAPRQRSERVAENGRERAQQAGKISAAVSSESARNGSVLADATQDAASVWTGYAEDVMRNTSHATEALLRSRSFAEMMQVQVNPTDTAIEIILDNHSAHVSRETTSWLAAQPIGRFTFTFTPTHGSWLNLIEGFFSKLARSVLRHIRVSSKHELGERLMAFIADVNREPVVHTWRYKIDNAA